MLNLGDVGVQEQVDVTCLAERFSTRARDDHAIVTIIPCVLAPDIGRVMTLQGRTNMNDNGLENIGSIETHDAIQRPRIGELPSRPG